MIVIGSAILGALIGYRRAAKLGGKGLDKAQWAGSMAIAFAILGMFLTILIERLVA